MSRKYKFRDNDKLYFISYAVVGWIDLFIRDEYRQVILESWKHCQSTKGLEIYNNPVWGLKKIIKQRIS